MQPLLFFHKACDIEGVLIPVHLFKALKDLGTHQALFQCDSHFFLSFFSEGRCIGFSWCAWDNENIHEIIKSVCPRWACLIKCEWYWDKDMPLCATIWSREQYENSFQYVIFQKSVCWLRNGSHRSDNWCVKMIHLWILRCLQPTKGPPFLDYFQ